MKQQLIILFLIVFNLGSADSPKVKSNLYQEFEKATIHFLDGTSIEGYGKLVGFVAISNEKYKIKFKASKEGKADVWTDLMVKGITFHYDFDDITYVYVKLSKKVYPRLLQVVEEGVVNLYVEIDSYWVFSNIDSANGFPRNTPLKKKKHITF